MDKNLLTAVQKERWSLRKAKQPARSVVLQPGSDAVVRRSVLGALGATIAIVAAGCKLSPPPVEPQVSTGATGIDVHCHVFNANDLPISGFILDVVLEQAPLLRLPLAPLVTLIALFLEGSAPSPEVEIAALSHGAERPFFVAPSENEVISDSAVHERALRAITRLRQPDDGVRAIERKLQKLMPPSPWALSAFSVNDGDKQVLLWELANTQEDGAPAPRAMRGVRNFAAPAPEPAAAADGFTRRTKTGQGVFYLARLLTSPRADLLQRLVRLPRKDDAERISLLTPAMVDYSFWLDGDPDNADCAAAPFAPPPDVAPLAQQIAVMSLIARTNSKPSGEQRTYAVHPFVSFCPWRQIAGEADPGKTGNLEFDLVKEAIENGGFIGIKLYPVMGFYPWGNAIGAARGEAYPARLRCVPKWAEALDAALASLFDWCVQRDVPVMAHCSFSQYPSEVAGKRGSPAAWKMVLDNPRWKILRLNLAHAGGIWNMGSGRTGGDWSDQVIEMLGRADHDYPNLYADLADFSDVSSCRIGQPAPATGLIGRLAAQLARHPAARNRLMYGTDWLLLARERATDDYTSNFRECLAPHLGMDGSAVDDFMGLNAARFLGLVPIAGKIPATRQRISRFLGDDSFFDRWGKLG